MLPNVERELAGLYGEHPLPRAGILHSVHAVRAADGRLHALRIDEHAPKSETDWFALSLCRARADAVLTSAENLRREPQLSHRLSGPWADTLTRYRAEMLGKPATLACAILTRSGDLPLDHPVWKDGTHKLVLCPPDAAALLRAKLGTRAEILAAPDLSVAHACRLLQARALALISVEAGPRSASSLYADDPCVTELWLTRWESAPAEAALAGALPADATLFAGLQLLGSNTRVEHGEHFRFERWQRVSP
jgi:riboflavin biosynthesis pyrimidine reductase